ncbi:MAG: ATPase [Treponema sp.]|jgi:hypothetical protein|nr:ATPase [Treponema sp.]
MEELQSTEILDREILEDARKKALRILKTADDTALAQTAEWEKKTASTLEDIDKKFAEQCRLASDEIMAKLPIDKHRAKAEKIENLLKDAVKTWYSGLSRLRILELLTGELKKRLGFIQEFASFRQRRAVFCGIERKEAESVLKSVNMECAIEEIPSADGYPSIILESENVRIIASVQKTVDYLLQEKRAELAFALLGSAFAEENA